MWLFLKVFSLLLLVFSYSKAEDLDTGNVLDPADDWEIYDEASSTNCSYSGQLEDGEVCTGGSTAPGVTTGGGGVLSDKIYILDNMSVAEMQQGFDFEYGATIESHVSNLTVPSCQNTSGDCKDYFTIKINISDSQGNSINTYENTVEMNYQGQKDYTYQETIAANNYSNMIYQMDIWSVDAGFTNGMYGGIISDPHLSFQYSTVDIVTDIILDVVDDIIQDSIDIEDTVIDVVLNDLYTEPVTIELDFTDTDAGATVIETVEVMEEIPEIQEIEAEIEEQIQEEIMEEIESVEEEPQEEAVEVVEESQEEPTRQEIKTKVAKKLLANVSKDKGSSQSQTTTLALMVVLSDVNIAALAPTKIQDTNYYDDLTFYDTQDIIQDPGSNYLGYMDYLGINEMVDSQWQN